MKHTVEVFKYGIRFRPIIKEDAQFICDLRHNEKNSRYIGASSSEAREQEKWIEAYLKRDDDYYFCIEKENGEKIGTIAIYDKINNRAEWGRWILKDKNLYSPTTVLLIYEIAFDLINLESLYCRTVIANEKVVSFHDNLGLTRIGIEENGVKINKVHYDLIVHEITKAKFLEIKSKLVKLAKFSERLLN